MLVNVNMFKQFIENYQEQAIELKNSFEIIENKWDLANDNQELYLQVGHLLNIILRNQKRDYFLDFLLEKEREINSIADELSDVFLSLFSIAKKIGSELVVCVDGINTDASIINNYTSADLCICLCVLCGQLSEAIMLLSKKRFNYNSKKDAIKNIQEKIGYMSFVTYRISELENIDMSKAFECMIKDASEFLKNFKVNFEINLIEG